MKQGLTAFVLMGLGSGLLAAPPSSAPTTPGRAFRGVLLDDAGQRSELRLRLDPARLAQGQITGSLEFDPPLGGRGVVLGQIQDELCVFQGTMDRGFDFSFRGRCSAELLEGTYVVRRAGGTKLGRLRAQAGEGKVEGPRAPENVAPPPAPKATPRPH